MRFAKLFSIALIFSQAAYAGGEIRLPIRSAFKSFDPAAFRYAPVILGIYETLYQYRYDDGPLTLEPLLASAMPKISRDGLSVTIPIKPGIHFSDDPCFKGAKGRELVSEDVAFTLKRLALPALASGWFLLDGRIDGLDALHERLELSPKQSRLALVKEPLRGLDASDPHALKIHLTKPYPQLAQALAIMVTAIVPHEAVEAYGSEDGALIDHPVGTGSFRLKEWSKGFRFVLERNPSCRADAQPRVDRVTFTVIDDESTAWLNYLAGQIDFVEATKDQLHISRAFTKKTLTLAPSEFNETEYLVINMKDPVLGGNKLLRQAISSALDRVKWNELFFDSRAEPAATLLPRGIAGRPNHPRLRYDYDPARAKALLAKAGFPGGKGLSPIEIEIGDSRTTSRQMGEFLQASLRAVGIPATLGSLDQALFFTKRSMGQLQVFRSTWTLDYPDAENIYALFYGPNRAPGENFGSFESAEYDALFKRISSMSPSSERTRLISRMDEILQEEIPLVLMVHTRSFYFTQSWLKNFKNSETRWNYLKYLETLKK